MADGLEPMSTVEELEAEKKRLELEKGIAETRAQIEQLRTPLWRRGGWVTAIATIIAAVIPVTTAIIEHYHKEQEIGLQKVKQEHEIRLEREKQTDQIRTGYLDRLKDADSRQRTLRFLIATLDAKDPVKQWATEEKKVVDEDARKLKEEISDLKQQKASTFAKLQETRSHSVQEKAKLQHDLDVEDVELADRQFDLKQSQEQLQSTQAELDKTTSELKEEERCGGISVRSAKDYQHCNMTCDWISKFGEVLHSKDWDPAAETTRCKHQCWLFGIIAKNSKCTREGWAGPPSMPEVNKALSQKK